MTQLNKSAAVAQQIINTSWAKKSQKNQLPKLTVKQFVQTARQRENPAAWLDKVEDQVSQMRRALGITKAAAHEVMKKSLVPPWFDAMHKSKEVKCKSRSDMYACPPHKHYPPACQ